MTLGDMLPVDHRQVDRGAMRQRGEVGRKHREVDFVGAADPKDFVDLQRRVDSLGRRSETLAGQHPLAQLRESCLGHQDLAPDRIGFDPTGDVDRTADDTVLGALVRADVAEDDHPGVDADPHLELGETFGPQLVIDLDHGPLHRQRTGDRAFGIVLVGNRSSEQREDGVADEVVDQPVIVGDEVRHRGEVDVERADDLLGRKLFTQSRKPA